MLAGQHAAALQDFVVICATDGNHGCAALARGGVRHLVPGYEEVPAEVMQGYSIVADEALAGAPPSLACPFSHFWEHCGAQRLRFVVRPEA